MINVEAVTCIPMPNSPAGENFGMTSIPMVWILLWYCCGFVAANLLHFGLFGKLVQDTGTARRQIYLDCGNKPPLRAQKSHPKYLIFASRQKDNREQLLGKEMNEISFLIIHWHWQFRIYHLIPLSSLSHSILEFGSAVVKNFEPITTTILSRCKTVLRPENTQLSLWLSEMMEVSFINIGN